MNLNERQWALLQSLTVGLGMGLGLGVAWQLLSSPAPTAAPAEDEPRLQAALPGGLPAIRQEPARAALSPATSSEFAPALDRLTDLLQAHLELAQSRRAPVTTPISPGNGSSFDGAEVVELTNAIWALSRSLDNRADPRSLSVPPRDTPLLPNRADAFGSGAGIAALESPDELGFERYATRFSGDHYGWTSEEVAAKYGRPDHIEVLSSESQWYYEVHLDDGSSQEGAIEEYTFCFSGNVVFSVNIDAFP